MATSVEFPQRTATGDLTTAALADADATKTVVAASEYTLASGILTTNRIITLGVTSAVTGEVIRIVRNDVSANTLTVKDDAATTLYTFPASTKRKADFRFDGAHFVLSGHAAIR